MHDAPRHASEVEKDAADGCLAQATPQKNAAILTGSPRQVRRPLPWCFVTRERRHSCVRTVKECIHKGSCTALVARPSCIVPGCPSALKKHLLCAAQLLCVHQRLLHLLQRI